MARRAGRPKMITNSLKMLPVGEVSSLQVLGRLVRKEMVLVEGTRFYRFTVDPGLSTEYTTFLSTDERRLYTGILKRLSRH